MKRKKPDEAEGNGAMEATKTKGAPMAKWQRNRLIQLNQVIARAARFKKMKQARKAYEDILKEKLQPSAQTFGALVNAAVRVGDLQEARRWLKASASFGVNPGVVAYTTLLKGLCEAGEMDQAREALQEMLENKCQPNIRTANTLLRGYRRAGEVDASVELLQQMENDWGVAPDATSSEYLVALLCQGFRVAAARRLLKRRPFQATQGRTGPRLRVAWTTTKKRREDLGGRV
ncbi:Pentatricopeptide repeat-containing protein At1g12300 [Durusdinium trenchii]|uniref:Mitochondrial n=1 Tax=Durusdinium trenchii TaxID=1381693 RepID=A0ABP0MQR5_9DINO